MDENVNGPIPADEMSDNERAFWAGIERMKARLQREHPELFDESGELDGEKAMKVILQATGGKTELTGEEFTALTGGAYRRRADASQAVRVRGRPRWPSLRILHGSGRHLAGSV